MRISDWSSDVCSSDLLKDLKSELAEFAHIEHMLSQLGDYTAIANRVALGSVTLEGHTYSVDDLEAAHKAITNDIAKTIRWGYVESTEDAEEKVGEPENLIVFVEHASNLVHARFKQRQPGLLGRKSPVLILTTT